MFKNIFRRLRLCKDTGKGHFENLFIVTDINSLLHLVFFVFLDERVTGLFEYPVI